MINFEKLNAMIDEVNNIIEDVEDETKNMIAVIDDDIMARCNYVCDELLKYCKILNKACDSDSDEIYKNIKASFEIPIQNTSGKFHFVYDYPSYAFHIRVLADEDDDKRYHGYQIVYTNRYDCVDIQNYKTINRSHPSIKWFLRICNDWNNYKSEVENAVVNAVNDILKQKSKFAHENNIKAKATLEELVINSNKSI